jgi:16S rRNA (uracil1498-N3)-methyltransferase
MTVRIYVDHDKIHERANIALSLNQAHYLKKVMRLSDGVKILCFNEKCGEFSSTLRGKMLEIQNLVQPPRIMPKKEIALGCIKRQRLEWAVEKLTEIGITDLHLLHTQRSQRIPYNFERMRAISIEAAEQSGRLGPINIHKPVNLADFIKPDCILMHQDGLSVHECVGCPIIGPEGGFSQDEIGIMSSMAKAKLANYTLRAETAAIIAASRLA